MFDPYYYAILGVHKSASSYQIYTAFKRLVKKYDSKNPIDRKIIKEIVKAYTVLSDPQERERYDGRYEYYLSIINKNRKVQPLDTENHPKDINNDNFKNSDNIVAYIITYNGEQKIKLYKKSGISSNITEFQDKNDFIYLYSDENGKKTLVSENHFELIHDYFFNPDEKITLYKYTKYGNVDVWDISINKLPFDSLNLINEKKELFAIRKKNYLKRMNYTKYFNTIDPLIKKVRHFFVLSVLIKILISVVAVMLCSIMLKACDDSMEKYTDYSILAPGAETVRNINEYIYNTRYAPGFSFKKKERTINFADKYLPVDSLTLTGANLKAFEEERLKIYRELYGKVIKTNIIQFTAKTTEEFKDELKDLKDFLSDLIIQGDMSTEKAQSIYNDFKDGKKVRVSGVEWVTPIRIEKTVDYSKLTKLQKKEYYDKLNNDYKSGKIDKDEAIKQLQIIKNNRGKVKIKEYITGSFSSLSEDEKKQIYKRLNTLATEDAKEHYLEKDYF